MNRRDFLASAGAAGVVTCLPRVALAAAAGDYRNLLILVELRGGNDGLNTVIPYASPEYYLLRPRLGVAREHVLQLDARVGLHPSLQPLLPVWNERELAVVQGLGYPDPNLSHFRSIEIWDTAASSTEYLSDGWLARTFAHTPPPGTYAADGVVVGGGELGPLAGPTARAIALASTEQFVRQAKLAIPAASARSAALAHISRVESHIVQAAGRLTGEHALDAEFPPTAFGNAARTAAQVIASGADVASIKIALNGFDTHSAQQATHARLLKELAEGLVALRRALVGLGRWDSTLVVTYSEFGRRPRENSSGGTDHGTASAHLVLGGRVKGGLHGEAPQLLRLDGNGNLGHAIDFRQLYATILGRWWGIDPAGALRGRYEALDLIRA